MRVARKLSESMSRLAIPWDNARLRALPVDESRIAGSRQVKNAVFSLVEPTPLNNPTVVSVSPSALALVGIAEDEDHKLDYAELAEVFSGNKLMPDCVPAAHCYCGHQFGYFAGQLGDGAAISLGETVNAAGERWELQLKGAGLTPYSRTADGRKVLRSTLREFLASEMMHGLRIPTTRAGIVIKSDSKVLRDPFYSGHAIMEHCAVVLRIAQSFIRFGSFEIFKDTDPQTGSAGPSAGNDELRRKMLEYTFTLFPELPAASFRERVLAMYQEVLRRTARLVAGWQCVGFCHGVLNTDNMSIIGDTLDYGPYGFMDLFDKDHICNGSDHLGRYTYATQPAICRWNCMKLGQMWLPEMPEGTTLKTSLETAYDAEFQRAYLDGMRKKLGLRLIQDEADAALVSDLFDIFHATGADFTSTFRALASVPLPSAAVATTTIAEGKVDDSAQVPMLKELNAALEAILANSATLAELLKMRAPLVPPAKLHMLKAHLHVMSDEERDFVNAQLQRLPLHQELVKLSSTQKTERDAKLWRGWLTRYYVRLWKEVEAGGNADARIELMNSVNPAFILRNHIAESAIQRATKGFTDESDLILKLCLNPFVKDTSVHGNLGDADAYYGRPPEAGLVCVTCSS